MTSAYGPGPTLGIPWEHVPQRASMRCDSRRGLTDSGCQQWCDENREACIRGILEERVRTECPGGERTQCGCLRRIQKQLKSATQAPLPGIDPEGLRRVAISMIDDMCPGTDPTKNGRIESFYLGGLGPHTCVCLLFAVLLGVYLWRQRKVS